KVLETNERTGDRIYRYRPVGVGGDHYRHCVNYLQLALLNLQDFQIGLIPVGVGEESEYDPMRWDL
ncbi:MAG: hypothetical protein ACUZ9M_00505, partial [Candidatus Scalindua sp.]